MVTLTKGIGKLTRNKGWAKRSGLGLFSKATITIPNVMVKACILFQMGLPTLETLSMTSSRVTALTYGKTVECTQDPGTLTTWRVRVSASGQMVDATKVTMKRIRGVGREFTNGQMDESMMECLKKANSMDKANILIGRAW